jgi:hypothetical protein
VPYIHQSVWKGWSLAFTLGPLNDVG